MSKTSPKKLIIKAVALAAVCGLIYWTIGDQWQNILETTRQADSSLLAIAFTIYGIALYFTCIRWHALLKAQNIFIPHWEIIKLHYSGYFFNTTTPGAVTGDVIKIAAVMDRKDNKLIAGMSIFIDRLIGLSGLLVVVLLSLIPASDFILSTEHKEIKLSIYIVSAGAVVGLLCVFLWCLKARLIKITFVNSIVQKISLKYPKLAEAFANLFKAGDLYQAKWRTCLALLFLSMLSHVLLGLSFYTIGKSLGLDVSPVLFILSMQISNALAAVFPLPGGLGLRDSIGKGFLIAAGTPVAMAATAPLIYTGVMLGWGLIGAITFLYWHFTK
ncbi:MAG: flippase-like domain-containing protein [Lentisphaerales bacterium]|nr:flippase-like domain-containing protein [Lentisphaerales bacterium]